MKKYQKYLISGAVVLVAILLIVVKYLDYLANPWTRDGRVRADIIQIAPRVSGPIVNLPIKDNQFVNAGDTLFIIDPRTFEAALAQARAELDQTGQGVSAQEKQLDAASEAVNMAQANVQSARSMLAEAESEEITNKREYERQKILLPKGSTSQKALDQAQNTYEVSIQQRKAAEAAVDQAAAAVRQARANFNEAKASLGQLGENNAQIRASIAALEQAKLNLEFTVVRAPADGYVTNLQLQYGSNTVANQPALALVDINSFYVDGYFKETSIGDFESGDKAIVTLMSYKNDPVVGQVESIGWGIAQSDGSTGADLLPNVSPTFEWIRLAQRIPVRISLKEVPKNIDLRVGTTCSVMVETGTTK